MARVSSRHKKEIFINIVDMRGGLDWRLPEAEIPDNSFTRLTNWEYDPISNKLKVRGGFQRHSTSAVAAGVGITSLFYYKNGDTLVCGCDDGNLYSYDRTTAAFTLIGALTGSSKAHMTEFNGKVIIASGGQLQSWDGTTLTTLSDSPSVCTIVGNRINRVITAGDTSNKERLYFSAVGDETDWTDGGTTDDAKWIDIGYKDKSGAIVGFAFWQGNMIIFKERGTTYRMQEFYPDWSPYPLTHNNTAVNQFCVTEFANDLFFLDYNGTKSFRTVMEYGDIKYLPIDKINSRMPGIVDDTAYMITHYGRNQIWFCPTTNLDQFYVYHPVINAFTFFSCDTVMPTCGEYIQDEDKMYLGADDGYIYTYEPDNSVDISTNVTASLQSKIFDFGRPDVVKILKAVTLNGRGISSGEGTFSVVNKEGSKSYSYGFSFEQGYTPLINDTDPLVNNTDPLINQTDFREYYHQLISGYGLRYEISVTEGCLELDNISGRLAISGRI